MIVKISAFIILLFPSVVFSLASLFREKLNNPGPGICSMYDICDSTKRLNCAGYRRAPKLQDLNTLNSIKQICGIDVVKDYNGRSCVSPEQWAIVEKGLRIAEPLLSQCPACWKNFLSLWCHMSVSPDQSLFLRVVEEAVTQTSNGNSVVTALDYFVAPKLKTTLFQSCANVSLGMTNKKVLSVMFSPEASTNKHVFFDMMGKNSSMRSPYLIRFPILPESPSEMPLLAYSEIDAGHYGPTGNLPWPNLESNICPLNLTMYPCDDPVYGCVCVDCHQKCPLPADWVSWAPAPCTIGFCSCWSFSIIISYCTLILILSGILLARIYTTFLDYAFSNIENQQDNSASDSYYYNYVVEENVSRLFYRQGKWVTTHIPQILYTTLVLVIFSIMILVFSNGLQIELDPVKLWVGPKSQSATQKTFYDKEFGPFYRVAQVILSKNKKDGSSAIITREAISLIYDILDEINLIKVGSDHLDITNLCFKPLGTECLVQSVALIWPNKKAFEASPGWKEEYSICMRSPTDCLSFDTGDEDEDEPSDKPKILRVPLMPELVVGGIPLNYSQVPHGAGGRAPPLPIDSSKWINAKSLVITILLDPSTNYERECSVEWERKFIQKIKEFESSYPEYEWAYSAESSVEWEINRETKANAPVVFISYLAMFLYVALALGRRTSFTSLKEARCTLAFGGVLLVAISILFSAAIFTLLKIKTTLIIAEVIPFLVLAVGVDNLFLLVQAYDTSEKLLDKASKASTDELVSERIALTLKRSGPSILVTELAELLAFILGCFVEMPAVSSFSMYAALAIACDILLQMTVFTAFLTIDSQRMAKGKMDPIAAKIQALISRVLHNRHHTEKPNDGDDGIEKRQGTEKLYIEDSHDTEKPYMTTDKGPHVQAVGIFPLTLKPEPKEVQPGPTKTAVEHFFFTVMAPKLARSRRVQLAILLSYSFIVFLALLGIGNIKLGLEQRLAVPSDSYLVRYFDALESDLLVGPPVFFVLRNAPIGKSLSLQRSVASRFYQDIMNDASLGSLVEVNKGQPGSYLASGISNWFDDFLAWGRHCCYWDKETDKLCTDKNRCQPCIDPSIRTLESLALDSKTLEKFLPIFLSQMPSIDCPFAGGAAYANQIGRISTGEVSAFKAYLQPLKSQDDFISSLRASRRIASILTDGLRRAISDSSDTETASNGYGDGKDAEIFAFSPYFIFFDQYLTIFWLSILLCSLCLLVIFLVTWILLGSATAALFATISVGSTAFTLFGVMGWWSIGLSAVSLVNVVIAMGISVEFSSNMVRSFMAPSVQTDPPQTRADRAEKMIAETGSSVFLGITLTKFIGVSILYWSSSKIFEVFYFRMYIATVGLAAFHGLALLPVLLSLFGPKAMLRPVLNK